MTFMGPVVSIFLQWEPGGFSMQSAKGKMNILIVDDVDLFIQLQVAHLGRQRYEIHTARSGQEGLAKARSLRPHLILLDLFMPDMNGDQVCNILKSDAETASIPVVLVSSGSNSLSRASVITSGCDALIFKPVRRDLLISVVENLLGTNTRSQVRARVAIPCVLSMGDETFLGTVHSMSGEGLFVEVDQNLIKGDVVSLSFHLPHVQEMISVRGAAVVWTGTLNGQGPRGAGMHFLNIDGGSKKMISEFTRLILYGDSEEPGGKGEGSA